MLKGKLNNISDVEGVSVGHVTLANGDVQTGVTALLPHQGNVFLNKCVAAIEVINGFGKSVGGMQINELGQLETPILLTNTLSVGIASDALVKYMLRQNPDDGTHAMATVNPVVMECNDGYLNDIRGQHITAEHVYAALAKTQNTFSQGSVGAGRGMSAYKLKGGIGSASRIVTFGEQVFTIGALVLTNMGRLRDFTYLGKKMADELKKKLFKNAELDEADKGSIIMILATDLPMDARQLKRLAKRATVGLTKTGSHLGHGSGDVCLAFSTANQLKHDVETIDTIKRFPENQIDTAFDAAIDAIEDAIINSMLHAETVIGRNGHKRQSLKGLL